MRLGLEVDSVPHRGDDIVHRFLLPLFLRRNAHHHRTRRSTDENGV